MVLAAGQSLSFYEILGPLGAGGMGEVWRARDTRLEREVAIKVLPEHFASDADRLKRFEREAKTLASLHHPNVASIFGIDQVDDTCFLAMELVAGEDLATRLSRGPLPVAEALDVCRQIAEGLEAAHEAGVVHRDLKPANVRVTPDGVVKILDFGLAKPIHPKAGKDGTTTAESDSFLITEEGLVLGTPTYMSPEQARGKPVDRRTDVWAFGCVLYECLTGKRAFGGDSLTDILAAIVEREPDWSRLPELPPRVAELLRRALTKDPRLRLRDVGEARAQLELAAKEPPGAAGPAAARRSGLRVTTAFALGVVLTAVAAWIARPDGAGEPPARRFDVRVPEMVWIARCKISPDGRSFVYVARDGIRIRDLGGFDARLLPGTVGAIGPAWSPDGSRLAYALGSELWTVPVAGGTPIRVATLRDPLSESGDVAWREDGNLVFATGDGDLFLVSSAGGEPHVIRARDPATEDDFHDAGLLPDGRGVLYVVHEKGGWPSRIDLFDGTTARTVLQRTAERLIAPVYVPGGWLVYTSLSGARGLWAVRFSLDTLEVSGEPVLIDAEGGMASAARDGTLAYVRLQSDEERVLRWYAPDGKPLEDLGFTATLVGEPSLSPDGTKVAFTAGPVDQRDIYVQDLVRGTTVRMTFTPDEDYEAFWTRDGASLAWSTGLKGDSWIRPCDGSSSPRALGVTSIGGFTPDDATMVFVREGPGAQDDIYAAPVADPSAAVPVVEGPARQFAPRLSPDGRFLIYVGEDLGREEVYLTTFPGGAGRWQVSVDGGQAARWSADGGHIVYKDKMERMFEVEFTAEPAVSLSRPRALMGGRSKVFGELGYYPDFGFDVDRNAARLLFVEPARVTTEPPSVAVVERWGDRPFAPPARR